ncbi:hypothetical protein [Pseudogracilibacillus sp. SO30301A]|uniref:hypothetical protein n=1 Tax=Pseudogracilibacillus sp. SO30301A TaxID=3098291 RepID=UPI00300DCD0E
MANYTLEEKDSFTVLGIETELVNAVQFILKTESIKRAEPETDDEQRKRILG